MIGIALKVHRIDAYIKDPWTVSVTNISKVHKSLDLSSIIKNNGGIQLPIG